jgi:hypothetical protein
MELQQYQAGGLYQANSLLDRHLCLSVPDAALQLDDAVDVRWVAAHVEAPVVAMDPAIVVPEPKVYHVVSPRHAAFYHGNKSHVNSLLAIPAGLSRGRTTKEDGMAKDTNAVRKVIDAAGGPMKLAREFGTTYTAINTFERQGYFPLARAKEAVEKWPDAAELRDLVRADIREAMDLQQGSNLLS